MDKFSSLSVFCKAVELCNFSQAARSLNISAAMVTKYIATLEAELATRLFNRSTRRVTPTEAGKIYYERCKQILSDLEEADSAVSVLSQRPSGFLKISAPMDFGRMYLMPVVTQFLSTYPEMRVDIMFDDREVNLIEDGFDMSIRIGKLDDSSLVAKLLTSDRLVVCASPEYLNKYGKPSSIKELADHNCLNYSYSHIKNGWFFGDDLGGKGTIIPVTGSFVANNGWSITSAAIAGIGVIYQPGFLVNDALASGELVEILEGCSQAKLKIYGMYPHRRFLSAKVRSFMEVAANYFQDNKIESIRA